MNILVSRMWFTPQSTIGAMSINLGSLEFYTLEPPVKSDGTKPRCTPDGSYKLKIQWSPHFQRLMPHVLDVPGFQGILLHWGNHPNDTEGCTLVGSERGQDIVTGSRLAFDKLFPLIQEAEERGEENYITYKSQPPAAPQAPASQATS